MAPASPARADERETLAWFTFGTGAAMLGGGFLAGGIGSGLVLSEEAPSQCLEADAGGLCLRGLEEPRDDTRARRAGFVIAGSAVMAIAGAILMVIGLDNVGDDDSDEPALSLRPDGFLLRF